MRTLHGGHLAILAKVSGTRVYTVHCTICYQIFEKQYFAM